MHAGEGPLVGQDLALTDGLTVGAFLERSLSGKAQETVEDCGSPAGGQDP